MIFPTAPSAPFFHFSTDEVEVTPISVDSDAQTSPTEDIKETSGRKGIPLELVLAAGAFSLVTSLFGGLTLRRNEDTTNPPIIALLLIAILLTITTILIELLFVVAEIILVLSGIGETPPGIFLGLILATLGLLLIDIDLAFIIYVYRVATALPGVKVQINLLPWEGWGLLSNEQKE